MAMPCHDECTLFSYEIRNDSVVSCGREDGHGRAYRKRYSIYSASV